MISSFRQQLTPVIRNCIKILKIKELKESDGILKCCSPAHSELYFLTLKMIPAQPTVKENEVFTSKCDRIR